MKKVRSFYENMTYKPEILPSYSDKWTPDQAHEYKPGEKFKPFVSRYPAGEIMQYEP